MAAAAAVTSTTEMLRPTRTDNGALEYSFDEQLCHRMQDETYAYLAGIRTRIELLGPRWNASTATALNLVMDQMRHHSTLLLPLPSVSKQKEEEVKKASAETPAASITSTATTTGDKSTAATTWTGSLLEWQQRHEELRAQLFEQMRECSLKSSVDNALFMGLFKTAQMVVPGVYIGSQSFVKSQKMLDEWGITHVLSCNGTSMLYGGRYGWCTLKMDDIEQQLLQPHLDVALEFIDRARLGREIKSLCNPSSTTTTKPSSPPRRGSAPSAPSEAIAVATASAAAVVMATSETPLQRAERMGRGRVLVHCSAGISRSVAMCIAWLMRQGYNHSATLPQSSVTTTSASTEVKSTSTASTKVGLKPTCISNYGDSSIAPISFDRCIRLMEATRPVVNPNPSFRTQLQELERYWIKMASSSPAKSTTTTNSPTSPSTSATVVPSPSPAPPQATLSDVSSDHQKLEVNAAV